MPEQGLCSASDPTVIDVCKAEGRCLVTLDLDFSNPVRFKPADYPGIAGLRLPPRPSPKDLTDSVLTLLNALAQSSIEGKLWILQRAAFACTRRSRTHNIRQLRSRCPCSPRSPLFVLSPAIALVRLIPRNWASRARWLN
ncbi:DUF5615 family PIN-like protein [Sorangium sp. So ce887]|uniref:DUF5615 family PIN-like protein n=1 Tax=Sorangium sp. So ce887 TaxID=3133324 RepID=UPI003F62489E